MAAHPVAEHLHGGEALAIAVADQRLVYLETAELLGGAILQERALDPMLVRRMRLTPATK